MTRTNQYAQNKNKKMKFSHPAQPSYVEMIEEAIGALNEKNGSITYDIMKQILKKYPHLPLDLESLDTHLRQLTKDEKLMKVKSFRFPPSLPEVPSSGESEKTKSTEEDDDEKEQHKLSPGEKILNYAGKRMLTRSSKL